MNIGVIRESGPGDRRVALTPPVVRRLVEAGHTVWVEAGAGEGATSMPQVATFGRSPQTGSLGRLPDRIALYRTEAADFCRGALPSEALLGGVSEAAERIRRELARGTA